MKKGSSVFVVFMAMVLLFGMGGCVYFVEPESSDVSSLQTLDGAAAFFPELTAKASIAKPEGWKEEKTTKEGIVVCYRNDPAVITLEQSYASGETSLADIVKYEKEQLEDNEQDLEELHFLMSDGIRYREAKQEAFAYSAKTKGQTWKSWCVFLREENTVFTVRCTAPMELFPNYEDVFNQTIASLNIL